MTCSLFQQGNVTIWVCGRDKTVGPSCRCGRSSTALCDFPLAGRAAGKTCSAPLCEACARQPTDDLAARLGFVSPEGRIVFSATARDVLAALSDAANAAGVPRTAARLAEVTDLLRVDYRGARAGALQVMEKRLASALRARHAAPAEMALCRAAARTWLRALRLVRAMKVVMVDNARDGAGMRRAR
jgi:hypothetical protein